MPPRPASRQLNARFADIVRRQATDALDLARDNLHDPDVVDAVRAMLERIREEAASLSQAQVENAASRAVRSLGTPHAITTLEDLADTCAAPSSCTHLLRPVAVLVDPDDLHRARMQAQNVASALRLVGDVDALLRAARAERLGAVWMPSGQLHALEDGRSGELSGVALYVYDDDDNLPSRLLAVRLGAAGFLTSPLNLKDAVRIVRDDAARITAAPWRVILVERTDMPADGFAQAIASDDLHVTALRGGFRLLETLDDVVPDILILSTQLDGVSTEDLLAVLRAHHRFNSVPVILLSATNETIRVVPPPVAVLRRSEPHLLLRRQIVEVAERTARMRAMREIDPSTGVLTDVALLRAADIAIANARRNPAPVTAVRIELPDLPAIRRSEGHGVAERILRAVGVALRDRLRTVDAIGRMGTTGFAAILSRCSARRAQARLHEIRDLIDGDIRAEHPIPVRMVFSFTDTASGREDLLLRADQLVSKAVASGVDSLVG